MSVADQGQYICTATNSFGSNRAVTQLYVDESKLTAAMIVGANFATRFLLGGGGQQGGDFPGVIIDPQDVTIGRGEGARLTCRAQASGNYQIRWSKQDGRLPYTWSQADGVLTIVNARPEDSGMFICTVTRSSGV